MANVTISDEREHATGWWFHVAIESSSSSQEHDVFLSFADYDHWSRGAIPPVRVMEQVFAYLLNRSEPISLPNRFDAGRIRRMTPEIDDALRTED